MENDNDNNHGGLSFDDLNDMRGASIEADFAESINFDLNEDRVYENGYHSIWSDEKEAKLRKDLVDWISPFRKGYPKFDKNSLLRSIQPETSICFDHPLMDRINALPDDAVFNGYDEIVNFFESNGYDNFPSHDPEDYLSPDYKPSDLEILEGKKKLYEDAIEYQQADPHDEAMVLLKNEIDEMERRLSMQNTHHSSDIDDISSDKIADYDASSSSSSSAIDMGDPDVLEFYTKISEQIKDGNLPPGKYEYKAGKSHDEQIQTLIRDAKITPAPEIDVPEKPPLDGESESGRDSNSSGHLNINKNDKDGKKSNLFNDLRLEKSSQKKPTPYKQRHFDDSFEGMFADVLVHAMMFPFRMAGRLNENYGFGSGKRNLEKFALSKAKQIDMAGKEVTKSITLLCNGVNKNLVPFVDGEKEVFEKEIVEKIKDYNNRLKEGADLLKNSSLSTDGRNELLKSVHGGKKLLEGLNSSDNQDIKKIAKMAAEVMAKIMEIIRKIFGASSENSSAPSPA